MIREMLLTGASALVMVSPFIIGAMLQRWNNNRPRYSTRELVEMQRNKINRYWYNK
jgi:hypothetical protein